MSSYFYPVDWKEHGKGAAGRDVPDYCINCWQPFMDHVNGHCPRVGPKYDETQEESNRE